MLFEKITILTEDYTIEKNMYIGVVDGIISYISKTEPSVEEKKMYGEIWTNTENKVLIPGFYNAHAHVPMSLLRGVGGGMNLSDWLNEKIFPFEAKLTGNDVYWATLLGTAEALKFGIVCNNDMYMKPSHMCKAYDEAKIKANLTDAAVCFDDRSFKQLSSYSECLELMQEYNKKNYGRIQVEFGLHAEYTSTEKIARGVAEACLEHNSPVHVHVAETEAEVEGCQKRHNGLTPVEYLNKVGLFDVRAIAAHCVHINEKDAEILAQKNVTIATCPISNLKLSSGVMPAKMVFEKGINVSVGTDGVSSNNNLNYIEDLKFFSLIHKGISLDPTFIDPKDALYASSRAGAIGLGRNDCGMIKVGMKADLVLLDYSQPHMQPTDNLLEHLVYSTQGGDVVMTMVDGNILYNNGEFTTIDIEKVTFEVNNSYSRIINSL